MAARRKKTVAASPIGEARASAARAQQRIRDALELAADSMQDRVSSARDQAQETWDNLEALFQKRVHKALQQIGVPTSAEIELLNRRVVELSAAVTALERRLPKSPRGAMRSATKRRRRA
jgi:poly(hydroxyalkanoate) granule-associated protein